MKKNSGQVVILLLLIMVVALAIGLSTIGRSILEVSTSRKSEDSSRAFSAAEAAIEKAIKENENNLGGTTVIQVNPFNLSNQAAASASGDSIPAGTNALGFTPYTKRAFAQFWLGSPDSLGRFYDQTSFDIYFGDPDDSKYTPPNGNLANQPAVEVNVIYWDDTADKYMTLRKIYDSYKTSTGFAPRIGDPCDIWNTSVAVDIDTTVNFYCRANVSGFPNTALSFPIMVRVRLLYTELAHAVALKPLFGSALPKQANLYRASGTSGDVKRSLEVTNYRSVMPQIFDYVLFSANNLIKQ